MWVNKYQEAIDYFTIGRAFTEEEVEDMYEMRYRLAELIDKLPYWLELEKRDKSIKPDYEEDVEKRESMKMFNIDAWYGGCEYQVSENDKHCDNCGQKLEWSDEE